MRSSKISNSTNGVTVNNRRITRQPLKDGDKMSVIATQSGLWSRPQNNPTRH